jgi:hypothetical protein
MATCDTLTDSVSAEWTHSLHNSPKPRHTAHSTDFIHNMVTPRIDSGADSDWPWVRPNGEGGMVGVVFFEFCVIETVLVNALENS